nr:hypothetical protein [uncultured bacterium]
MSERQIYAAYDDAGIYVYQAFMPSIVQAALAKGTFGDGFAFDRMTWIKPSFGWMLYRSGYATKPNQEAILKIKLSHAGFLAILRQSVPSTFDPSVFPSPSAWKSALSRLSVRHQWDPDRDVSGHTLQRRAIQIGISGATVLSYVNEWIIGLEDVTVLAQAIQAAVQAKLLLPDVPEERLYPVDEALQHSLGMSSD